MLATSAYHPTNRSYAESTNRPLAAMSIAFQAPADGTYDVVASDGNGGGAPNKLYTLDPYRNE